MKFYSIDKEAGTVTRILEPRTIKEASRCIIVAVGRWLLSGLDSPDSTASDGVSEYEATLQ
jgi:hypothetical protein